MELIRKRVGSHSTGKYLKVLAIATLALGSASSHALTIVGSKHDLSSGGTAQATTTATTEVCVFCHTPHGSDTSASVPLWNKKLTPTAAYIRYSSLQTSTLDGSEAPVGSVSLACLSCHDGTQAMDVVINAPGSGGYVAAGSELSAADIGVMVGVPAGAPIPALGLDLSNDHPISIQYGGGGCSSASTACTTTALGDGDFKTPDHAVVNTVNVWWVDTGTVGKQKTDMQLYTRTDITGGTGLQEPTVECGSCHDPHEAEARPVSFMRISNDNSAVCTACHIK